MPRHKQDRLPTMQDPELEKLEALAGEYDECGKRRKQLKLDLLAEMHEQGRKHYLCNGLEITVVDGTEGVRVTKITTVVDSSEVRRAS